MKYLLALVAAAFIHADVRAQQDTSRIKSDEEITGALNGAWKWTGTFRNGEFTPRISLTYYFIFDDKKLYWIFDEKSRGVFKQDDAYEVQYRRSPKGIEVDAYPMANGMRLPGPSRWLMKISKNRLYQARTRRDDTYPNTFDSTGRDEGFSVAVFERTKEKITISDRLRNKFVVKHKRTTNRVAEATLKRFIAALASHSFSEVEKLSVASTFEGFKREASIAGWKNGSPPPKLPGNPGDKIEDHVIGLEPATDVVRLGTAAFRISDTFGDARRDPATEIILMPLLNREYFGTSFRLINEHGNWKVDLKPFETELYNKRTRKGLQRGQTVADVLSVIESQKWRIISKSDPHIEAITPAVDPVVWKIYFHDGKVTRLQIAPTPDN